jgi:hypothetical protein
MHVQRASTADVAPATSHLAELFLQLYGRLHAELHCVTTLYIQKIVGIT